MWLWVTIHFWIWFTFQGQFDLITRISSCVHGNMSYRALCGSWNVDYMKSTKSVWINPALQHMEAYEGKTFKAQCGALLPATSTYDLTFPSPPQVSNICVSLLSTTAPFRLDWYETTGRLLLLSVTSIYYLHSMRYGPFSFLFWPCFYQWLAIVLQRLWWFG